MTKPNPFNIKWWKNHGWLAGFCREIRHHWHPYFIIPNKFITTKIILKKTTYLLTDIWIGVTITKGLFV